jgi:hypothetical protein
MEKESSLENIPKSLKLARQLENSTDLEFIKTHLGELLDLIHQDTGSNLLEDVEKIYREMKETGCLVRVEQLYRIRYKTRNRSPRRNSLRKCCDPRR